MNPFPLNSVRVWVRASVLVSVLMLDVTLLSCSRSSRSSAEANGADAGGAGLQQVAGPTAASAPGSSFAPVEVPPPAQTDGFDGQQAYDYTAKLVSFGPRPPDSDAIHRTQDYIREQLKSFGCAVSEDDFHSSTPIGSVAMKNIVAEIPGKRRPIILLLTHYDTLKKDGFVGAVDGGSSSGLMLEMARLLCGHQSTDTIWIAFLDGEEAFEQWSDADSTYGSRELAARMALSGDLPRIKAVLLADMVGAVNLHIQKDTNSTPKLVDLVWKTAARLGYTDTFVQASTPIEDDHLSFLHRNVPAVDVIDLLDYPRSTTLPYWHTTQDTMDKVSPRSLAIVGHVLIETVRELQAQK
jgi:glutaminyl-peptide cyclotransferase